MAREVLPPALPPPCSTGFAGPDGQGMVPLVLAAMVAAPPDVLQMLAPQVRALCENKNVYCGGTCPGGMLVSGGRVL